MQKGKTEIKSPRVIQYLSVSGKSSTTASVVISGITFGALGFNIEGLVNAVFSAVLIFSFVKVAIRLIYTMLIFTEEEVKELLGSED